ncbi:MAG: F0F1 ATP synthase subunit epsilon [Desulfobacterales bacterium]|nr:F0F1 ATP synthase subunit epsilon [Desulfobacterales bacterium]
MTDNIKLEIVTPDRIVVDEDAQIVMAPGTDGEFGVLSGHTPFLTSLQIGTVQYTDAGGNEHSVFVSGGFTEALPDKVTVLAESAERHQDIDIDRAKAAMERAQNRIADEKSEDTDFTRAKTALARAMHRIKITGNIS